MFPFGVDYYPEHWPEERWPIDAALMAETGINIVRLAEFAWSRLEPSKGHYEFNWLDNAIAMLADQNIGVILGTPTASPPPWLMTGQPELFRVRADGLRVTYGNRRTYCPTHPTYHAHTARIVRAMAEHYADHPAVVGWQIDNEFGDRCYCPLCRQAFQRWLQSRYPSLDALNEAWGTFFWSHTYSDWNQVPVPVATAGSPNPGLALDFARFASDSYVAYQKMQIDLLREIGVTGFITHNFMGFRYDQIDYFDLARDLDFVSWDSYPRMQWTFARDVDPAQAALGADTMRGLKGRNFWMMEQQAGPGGWEMVSVTPRPGELRLWAYQSIAHGADAMIFFRWRTALAGTEQYWHGLLDHDGTPGRRYAEIKRMASEMARVGDTIYGSQVRPHVAIMLSYDSRFAFQIQPNNPHFNYPDHFGAIYAGLHRANVTADVVAPTSDLAAYRLVIVPALYVTSEQTADNLRRFAEAGGVVAITQRSGVKDEQNRVVDQRLPGLLAELCGVEVEEYDSLTPEMYNCVEYSDPALAGVPPSRVGTWCDVLNPTTARVIATYSHDFYAGKPAITSNSVGQGSAIYIGTVGDTHFYEVMARWLLRQAGIDPLLEAPPGVEVTERRQGDRRLLFVLNHSTEEQSVELPRPYTDLLTGASLSGEVQLGALEVLLLSEAV
jgi:beta-galactosidase